MNILAKLQFNPHHSVVKQLIVAILVVERLVTVVCSRPLSKYAATPHHTHHISHTITDTSHTHITSSTVDTIGKKLSLSLQAGDQLYLLHVLEALGVPVPSKHLCQAAIQSTAQRCRTTHCSRSRSRKTHKPSYSISDKVSETQKNHAHRTGTHHLVFHQCYSVTVLQCINLQPRLG